jgi:DNA-binding MarR family transcriptional regulator
MIRKPNEMADAERIDLLFQSVLSRFFTIPAKQPALGATTFAQMRVLWVLDFKKSACLHELAGLLGVSNPTATELVDRLVRFGHVRRVQCTHDRRQVELTLTPKGRRLLAEFARRRRERFEKLFRVVAPADVRRMAHALETMNEVLGRWHG